MSTSGTLLIEALLERLSPAQAKTLLDQLDRLLAQKTSHLQPEQSRNARRHTDSDIHPFSDNAISKTLKDQLS